jgi:hypothetical protein
MTAAWFWSSFHQRQSPKRDVGPRRGVNGELMTITAPALPSLVLQHGRPPQYKTLFWPLNDTVQNCIVLPMDDAQRPECPAQGQIMYKAITDNNHSFLHRRRHRIATIQTT